MSLKNRSKLGAIGIMGTMITGLGLVAGWALTQLYLNLDGRVSDAQTSVSSVQSTLQGQTALLIVIAQHDGIPNAEITQLLNTR